MARTVADVMTRKVAMVRGSAPFKEIAALMEEFRVSALPVLDESGRLMGIVSEGDLLLKEGIAEDPDGQGTFEGKRRRRERTKATGRMAADLMTTPVVTVEPGASLARAARLMHDRGVKRLPVVDADQRVLGIVSRADMLKVFLRPDEEIRREVADELACRAPEIDPGRVRVEVTEGVVTLHGEIERASVIPVLVGLARGVDGVVGVDDRLSFEVDDLAVPSEVLTPWGVYAPSLRPDSSSDPSWADG